MKRIMILAAMGLLAGSAGAQAQQTCFQQQAGVGFSGINACVSEHPTDRDGVLTDNETTNVVDSVTFPGIAVTETAPVPLDANNDGVQDVDANGRLLFKRTGPLNLNAEAHGNNAVAVGAGARVGKFIPEACSSGTLATINSRRGCVDAGGNEIANSYKAAHTEAASGGTALGSNAVVEAGAHNGTAIGHGANVSHEGSTAIGAGAKSTDTNQATLGTKDETIRAEGITSQKSKDRQVGPTELVTSDSGGRLATDGGQTFARIDSLESAMTTHGQAISAHTALLSEHTKQLDEQSKGIAIAMALPDAWLGEKERFAIAGNIGGFGDETALGVAAIARLDQTWSLNAKLGADTSFDQFGWTVGARAGW